MSEPKIWEDADFEPQRVRRPSQSRLPILIGAGVGGVAFLSLVACCGFGSWFLWSLSAEAPAAQAVAEGFLDDLRVGRVDEAYARTSHEFRKGLTQEQFRAFVKPFPALTENTSRSLQMQQLYKDKGGTQASFAASLTGKGDTTNCTIKLLKEADGWKVNFLSVL